MEDRQCDHIERNNKMHCDPISDVVLAVVLKNCLCNPESWLRSRREWYGGKINEEYKERNVCQYRTVETKGKV
jgi:hypothetical protein